jgi:hypothetical protein
MKQSRSLKESITQRQPSSLPTLPVLPFVRATSYLRPSRNFAGIFGTLTPTWETDADAFRKVIEVNTTGVWLCNKHELKQMMKQDSVEV